jgi:5-formyltetrahydrofolate cyclo-ligase
MQVKAEFRRELISRRRNMTDKSEKDSAIFMKLVGEIAGAGLVLTYVSTKIEVDTKRLIEHCFENNIDVAIPAIVDDEMQFYYLNRDWTLGDNCQSSIADYQLCIVPGLAFNQAGYRLGYGGGYYDRFLKNFPGVKIGLCYGEFMMDIPTQEHDERVDRVIWI